ncbi:MAG: MerR family transcriptional regulator [Saprospiraceae bacterium]
MAIYSIRDLEKLTGIKAHTIRIWEQRYGLVAPSRTDTNIRFYSDENLRHLFNVALLNRYGYKISKLAKMQPEEVATKVADFAQNNNSPNAQVEALTLAMLDFDEAAFDRIFAAYFWENGFEQTLIQLIYPFLDRLTALWMAHNVSRAHEKFITNLIKRKMMVAIDKESAPSNDASGVKKLLLYLPDSEGQELTLLFLHYLLKVRHHNVIYLGAGISLDDLRDAAESFKPDYVFTILHTSLHKQPVQAYIDSAAQIAAPAQILLTGAQVFANPLKLPPNAHRLSGMSDTLQFLDTL